jgi:tetratricopeptide (TPR) repeat protein
MQKVFTTIATLLWVMALSIPSFGQTQLTTTPRASQQAATMQRIGLTDVKVVYHRPATKDREIWGKLVPNGTVWRAGANENTIIKFSTDVTVEGERLAAGKYGLHIIPDETSCTIIFSNNSTSWGSFSYNQAEDALRIEAKLLPAAHNYEFLTFEFDGIERTSANCNLIWGNKKVVFNIETDVDGAVIANLRNELRDRAGWSWQGWNEAAAYCLQNEVNLKEGLQWATRSVFMSPNPFNMRTKALLTGKIKGKGNKDAELKYSIASFTTDLTSQPCTWKEWNAAATFASQNKAYDEALYFADNSIAMNSNMTNMMAKVNILKAKGDEKMADKLHEEAVAKGSNAELNNYGYQLMFGGKVNEAVKIFEANASKNPDDPNVWDSLAEGYKNQGNREKAIKACKKSLSLNPPANVKANTMKTLNSLGVDVEDIKP